MRSDGPYIEVKHSEDRIADIASHYNCDSGPLALPKHITLGSKSYDGSLITSYADQVTEYDVWLEDQIKAQNIGVLTALDDIYNKAIQNGIVLQTRCVPQPYITHAHVIKNTIMKLAGG